MIALPSYSPDRIGTAHYMLPPTLKRTHADMKTSRPPSRWVDHDYYLNTVLRIPSDSIEDAIDQALHGSAEALGLNLLQEPTDVEAVTCSMSATTIASEPTTKSSIISQSTAATSCSSSEVRPVTAPAPKPFVLPDEKPPPVSAVLLEIEKKRRNNAFRNGIRKMTGFSRKKKSVASSTLTSISSYSDLDASVNGDDQSLISDIKSPSLKSKESSGLWSRRLSTTEPSSYEQQTIIDHDALRRSMECKEMISLRAQQLEDRQRFLDYQSELVSKIRAQRDAVKAQKREVHQKVVNEQMEKNDKAVEDLESRQLEEELKMLKEHEVEKRTVLVRLRHMEAYCQTPSSPPPTPSDLMFTSGVGSSVGVDSARGSVDSNAAATSPSSSVWIPDRRVTDKDYHNLAQQYRERDAMDNLHASKINVLRGKQKRAVENFILKRERAIEVLEQEQQRELDAVDFEFGRQEADCRSEFDVRRKRLEDRWRLQAKIERKKREDATGLKFGSLPDVLCIDNCSVELMLRPNGSVRQPRDLPTITTN